LFFFVLFIFVLFFVFLWQNLSPIRLIIFCVFFEISARSPSEKDPFDAWYVQIPEPRVVWDSRFYLMTLFFSPSPPFPSSAPSVPSPFLFGVCFFAIYVPYSLQPAFSHHSLSSSPSHGVWKRPRFN